MDTYSNDYSKYSISFGTAGRSTDFEHSGYWYNTWRDWHMVPTSRPVVDPPNTRTQYITVPGRDGPLDYTEAIDGVHFDIYTGSWEFVVLHEFNERLGLTWSDVYSDIMNALHGREMQVIFSERTEVCYTGRLFVEAWKSEDHYSKVTIKYELDPMLHLLEEWHKMNDEYCRNHYRGWLEFPTPFKTPYSSRLVNRIGAYIRFEKPHPTLDKVVVYVSTRFLPKIRIRGAAKGLNVAHASVIPFIGYDDEIIATGETNAKLKMGTINAVRSSSTGVKQWLINPNYISIKFPNAMKELQKGQISDDLHVYRAWENMANYFDDDTKKRKG